MLFLVPDIAGTPTGGNVYNRRILDAWPEGLPQPNVVTWPVEVEPTDPFCTIEFAETVIVDSLCLEHDDALRDVRAQRPNARLILLAHYLNCVDPHTSDGGKVAAERDVLPLFDGAVTPSEYVRNGLIREGMPPESVRVVPPGLDPAFRSDAPNRSVRSHPVRLLTVANVLPGKGLDVLLEALDTIQVLDWTWRLIGGTDLDAAYGASFREQLRASPIRDRIRWNGVVDGDAMPAAYDDADLFVLPTRFETCSMATREAMARGLPVVASKVGGLPENLAGEAAGHLVPPDDADALAEALRDLIVHPEQRHAMGEAARDRSAHFPAWPEAARRFARFARSVSVIER